MVVMSKLYYSPYVPLSQRLKEEIQEAMETALVDIPEEHTHIDYLAQKPIEFLSLSTIADGMFKR